MMSEPPNFTDEFRLEIIRATRNRLLYITDTLMLDDRPDVNLTELKTYRKALRDITNQTIELDEFGGPIVNWPTKPQCVKDVELNFAPNTKEYRRDRLIETWSPPIR